MKKLLLIVIATIVMFNGCADKNVRNIYKSGKAIHRALPVQNESLKVIGAGVEAIDGIIIKQPHQ